MQWYDNASIRVNLRYRYWSKVRYSTGTVVTSPQDHWMIKVRQRGELERKYRYLREEKIFKPMKRFRNQKRSELNEVRKRKKLWKRCW